MNGCSLNLETINPLNAPTSPPTAMEMSKPRGISHGLYASDGNILFITPFDCNSEAHMQAQRPTQRPAERSVPVRTMAPAIPKAIISLAADCMVMFTIESNDRKFVL